MHVCFPNKTPVTNDAVKVTSHLGLEFRALIPYIFLSLFSEVLAQVLWFPPLNDQSTVDINTQTILNADSSLSSIQWPPE